MTLSPIILFVYNRPEHTRRTVEALVGNRLASESELFVFSDAAKGETDKRAVEDVRKLLGSVTGFKSVEVIERETNYGLAKSITTGVTQLVNRYGRVIVLEDDLITSPYFLTYMNDALERYKDEPRVMQISGHMFPVKIDIDEDALFLPFTTSWGWGTWRRAWATFGQVNNNYHILKNDKSLRKKFDLNGNARYFGMLSDQFNGKIDSWAIQWYANVFVRDGLVLFPRESLIENKGFDGSGTHCVKRGNESSDSQVCLSERTVKKYPLIVEESPYCEVIMNSLSVNKSVIGKLIRFIRQLI